MPRGLTLLAVLIVCSPALLGAWSESVGAAAPDTGYRLPRGVHHASAVASGSHVYVLGGVSCVQGSPCTLLDGIIRYTPSTGSIQTLPSRLPGARHATAAIADGGVAYLFGGRGSGAFLDEIVRIDLATGNSEVLATRMPLALAGMAAAWDGAHVYLFGGYGSAGASRSIQRFTPATGAVEVLAASLPAPRYEMGGTWAGDRALLLGGYGCPASCDTIFHFFPSNGTLQEVPERLPFPRWGSPALWDGQNAYLFGGCNSPALDCTTADVLAYNPLSGTFTQVTPLLPKKARLVAAAWDGENASILGGEWDSSLDTILRYGLRVSAPRQVSPTLPGPGKIRLTWSAPPVTATGGPIIGYRVYAGDNPASPSLVAEVGAGAPRSFTETGLAPGSVRFYRLSALTERGEGIWSAAVRSAAAVPPSAPQDVTARAAVAVNGGLVVRVNWLPPQSNGGLAVSLYHVYRAVDDGPETLIGETTTNQQDDRGCPAFSECHYRVSARNAVGEGSRSERASAYLWGLL